MQNKLYLLLIYLELLHCQYLITLVFNNFSFDLQTQNHFDHDTTLRKKDHVAHRTLTDLPLGGICTVKFKIYRL